MKFETPGRLRLKRVRVPEKDPAMRELMSAIEDLVQQLDERFASIPFTGIPINVPFPFRASAFPSTFRMDERLVPCDGRRIVDRRSPLNGQFAPTINDNLGGAETLTWYIRVRD